MTCAWTAAREKLAVFGAFDAGHGGGDKEQPEYGARDLKYQHRQVPCSSPGHNKARQDAEL